MKRIAISLLAGVASLALLGAAHAADLIIDEPMVGFVETAGGNWEGVYLGAFIGGASGDFDDATENDWFAGGDESISLSGWMVGVNAGANFYLTDGVVGGIVGDIAWSDVSGTYEDFADYTINWQGSLRGKLGFDAGAFMPYVTGGLAVANGTFFHAMPGTESQTHVGWTVGAGVEIAATEDLSIDVLYRYSNFGEKEYFEVNGPLTLDQHAVTAGLNWKF